MVITDRLQKLTINMKARGKTRKSVTNAMGNRRKPRLAQAMAFMVSRRALSGRLEPRPLGFVCVDDCRPTVLPSAPLGKFPPHVLGNARNLCGIVGRKFI